MPHIHIQRRPRKTPATAILILIVMLLVLAAIAWYFVAGPGQSQIHSLTTGVIGVSMVVPQGYSAGHTINTAVNLIL